MAQFEIYVPSEKYCKAAQVLVDLDEHDIEAVKSWVKWKIGAPRIGRMLRKAGHPLGDSVIALHMKKQCCCSKPTDLLYGVKNPDE